MKYYLAGLLAILLAGCAQSYQAAPAAAIPEARGAIFLPIVGVPSPLPTPTATPDPDATCFHNPKALAFYRLLVGDRRQQRPRLGCHPALVKAAEWRADGLATGDPWSHTDADGVTPNEYARQAGCKLPAGYAVKGNGIESLTAGTGVVEVAYWSLTNDQAPDHRRHLLGEIDFFRRQPDVGIAYAEGGALGWYWVILIAECTNAEKASTTVD